MSDPVGSTSDAFLLKFFFANQDGVHVVLSFPRSAFIADVKAHLAQHWPTELAPPETLKSIRLICMGRGMLQDHQTLETAKVPAFETHATPVNVSVLRRQVLQAAGVASSNHVTPKPSSGNGNPSHHDHSHPPGAARGSSHSPSPTPGCGCVLM